MMDHHGSGMKDVMLESELTGPRYNLTCLWSWGCSTWNLRELQTGHTPPSHDRSSPTSPLISFLGHLELTGTKHLECIWAHQSILVSSTLKTPGPQNTETWELMSISSETSPEYMLWKFTKTNRTGRIWANLQYKYTENKITFPVFRKPGPGLGTNCCHNVIQFKDKT